MIQASVRLGGWIARARQEHAALLATPLPEHFSLAEPGRGLRVVQTVAAADLLRFLVRRIGRRPVLLVASYRDDELGEQHPLSMLLGDLATAPGMHRIGLERLSANAIADLAAGTEVDAVELFQLTGGNPFYATEVLATGGATDLPRSVSDAVGGRLARLSVAGRQTAYAAAVCGPRATLDLIREMCVDAPTGLTECLTAGVLLADHDAVTFRHELARRATLDMIAGFERPTLHRRALDILTEPPIDPNILGTLALHADQAHDTESVLNYGPAAAERASALGANREAAELYALTLRHADTVPDEQKVLWFERHAFSGYLTGLGESALASWQAAIALRHKLDDTVAESIDLIWLSHQSYLLGRTSEALNAAEASLGLLEEQAPGIPLAWSLAAITALAAFRFDPACAGHAARAVELGTAFGDATVVVRARFFGLLATVLRTDTGWEELEAVWRESMTAEGLFELGGLNGGLICWFAAVHHRLPQAESYIAETVAFCSTHDLGMFEAITTGAAALTALHRGDWAAAVDRATTVLTRPGLPPPPRILPLICVALVRARRGERSVQPLLDEALAAADADDLARLGVVWAARAEAAWLAGDDGAACREASAGLAAASEHADPWLVEPLLRWIRLAGLAL